MLLVEKERHPRFHIGESLLPLNSAMIDRLGLRERVVAIGRAQARRRVRRADNDGQGGAVLLRERAGQAVPVLLAGAAVGVRCEMLFEAAAARGARTMQRDAGDGGGAGGRSAGSGRGGGGGRGGGDADRAALSCWTRRGGTRSRRREAGRASRRTGATTRRRCMPTYTGAAFRTGAREGYISVHLAEDGWFWMIPLPDGVMSVGFVGHADGVRAGGGGAAGHAVGDAGPADRGEPHRLGADAGMPCGWAEAHGNGQLLLCRARPTWIDGCLMIGDAYRVPGPGVQLGRAAGDDVVRRRRWGWPRHGSPSPAKGRGGGGGGWSARCGTRWGGSPG